MARETILVVEDDENIQQLVGYNLARAGYHVIFAEKGDQALQLVKRERPHLVVLDIMLPILNGYEVCKALRENPEFRSLPIIMLTAKSEESEVATGLDLGADDYITKPFSPKILVSRIKAVLRRRESREDDGEKQGDPLAIHNMTIDSKRFEVRVEGELLPLTVTEFGIMELLARRPGWVFSRQQIIDGVRGYGYVISLRAVDVQIFGLRKKLGAAGKYIETIRGIGYRMQG